MTRGERIRCARIEKALTLEELAKMCGTTKQTINKYENGTITNIPSDKVELLAAYLDISPGYIMGWDISPAGNTPSTSMEEDLLALFRRLNTAGKAKILEDIKDMTDLPKYTKHGEHTTQINSA